ncbi:MAG: hypothetical protein U1E77_19675 [Inhella sp.]
MCPTPPLPPLAARLINVGHDTADLLRQWLAALGVQVCEATQEGTPDLVLLECAFPRHEAQGQLAVLARHWPAVPVILLSPTLFASVPARGALAAELGVAAVLATPLVREHLTDTVRAVLAS